MVGKVQVYKPGDSEFQFSLKHESWLGHFRPVLLSQSKPPHRIVVRGGGKVKARCSPPLVVEKEIGYKYVDKQTYV